MGMGGAGWRQPWDSLAGTDLIGVPAGVIQSQQQRHETLQHQLPQGAAEPHPEPAPAAPHQRPEEPDCRGADRVPGLHSRARSGRNQQGEGVRRAAVWGHDLGARSGAWLGNPGRAWGGGGDGGRGGAGGASSRLPEAVGGAVPAPRPGAAPAPAAASGSSAASPVRCPRAARHPRPGRPGARAAACSRDAPAGTGTRGRPLADPTQTPPSPAPHLPAVQRQVAEAQQAQQAQPVHGGLGVALPSAEPLQDDLLPQKPCGGPALQQLGGGDTGSARSRSRAGPAA